MDELLDKVNAILGKQAGTLDVEGIPFHVCAVETCFNMDGSMRLHLRLFVDAPARTAPAVLIA